jgi:hypothetical protein
MFNDEGNYVPLEWVHPKDLRDRLWTDAEAQLIYHFQPELNTDLRGVDTSELPTHITLFNYAHGENFDALSIYPHRDVSEDEWSTLTN